MRIPIPFEYGGEPFSPPATAGLGFPFFLRLGGGLPQPVIEIIDTHDGDIERRKRWDEQRRARERLRNQLVAAFEYHVEGIEPALERIAVPGPRPLVERVDIEALEADLELSRTVREAARAAGLERATQLRRAADAARRAALDADDEEALLLLM